MNHFDPVGREAWGKGASGFILVGIRLDPEGAMSAH